jgi:hypothetical protein
MDTCVDIEHLLTTQSDNSYVLKSNESAKADLGQKFSLLFENSRHLLVKSVLFTLSIFGRAIGLTVSKSTSIIFWRKQLGTKNLLN